MIPSLRSVTPQTVSKHSTTDKKELNKERDLLVKRLNNMRGNLRDIEQDTCSLAGTWNGAQVDRSTSEAFPMTLILTESGDGYACELNYRFDRPSCRVSGWNIDERWIELIRITSQTDHMYFALDISSDFKSMTGQALPSKNSAWRKTAFPSPITLSKQ